MPLPSLLPLIQESWNWTGLNPAVVTATNAFGNILARALDGTYWRICPEELYCEVVAGNDAEFQSLWESEDFQEDWQMQSLVEIARVALGPVSGERCYCLKIPAVLGGKYETSNLGTITIRELIAFTGDAAKQIKDIPDGASITFDWKV